jgi:arginine/serine-rich splicing factor 17
MDVPCKWFAALGVNVKSQGYHSLSLADLANVKPSEEKLKQVFSIFGELRQVDIPMLTNPLDAISLKKPYSSVIVDNMQGSNQGSNAILNMPTFEAFIQYKDYISFVKAMDTFRGMKMLYIEDNSAKAIAYSANIRVDFDRTKHLSDKEIKKREIDKLKNIEVEKIKNAQQEKEKEKESKQKEIANFRSLLEESMGGKQSEKVNEKTKEQRRREREEIRRQKRMNKKQQEEEKKLEQRIALEERKILIAQRKLESMRLLEELFNRVKVGVAQEELEKHQKNVEEAKRKKQADDANEENIKRAKHQQEELELREKVEANLAREEAAAAAARQMEEDGEFELRKVQNSPGDQQNMAAGKVMPRAVLLSNAQQLQQMSQAKLYDDEEDNKEAHQNASADPADQSKESINHQSSKEGEIEDSDSDGMIDNSKNNSNNNSLNTNESLSNTEENDN